MPRKILSFVFLLLCVLIVCRPQIIDFFSKPDRSHQHGINVIDVTEKLNIDFQHEYLIFGGDNTPITPWFESLGANVSVADINQDGFQDIFFLQNSFSPNHLYINRGDGTFREAAAEYGLQYLAHKHSIPLRSLFFDCDNDNIPEIFITRLGCPSIYKWDPHSKIYKEKQLIQKPGLCHIAIAANSFDFNGDGFNDLIYGGNYGRRHRLPMSFFDAKNGHKIALLINNGRCEFSPNEELLKGNLERFYHSIGIGDLNNDNQLDMWLAVDFNEDAVFLKRNGKYINESEKIGYYGSRTGMNSEMAYLSPKQQSVFVSHIQTPGYNTGGNSLWEWNGKKFLNKALESGVYDCDWAWGAHFFDIENDGDLDLAVTNGFYSGPKKREYWFFLGTMSSTSKNLAIKENSWPDMTDWSLSGYQKDCIFINDGQNKFSLWRPPSFDSGHWDGRGLATIDINNDGRKYLIVAQQKTSHRVYEFETDKKSNWLGLKLKGKNWTSIGAKVKLFAGGQHLQTRENIFSNVYASQSEPRIHFGLGSLQSIDYIEIFWPSGNKQQVDSLPLNKYHTIEEI